MDRSIGIAFVLFAVFLFGCPSSSSSSKTEVETVPFSENGITFNYPKSWSFESRPPKNGKVSANVFKGSQSADADFSIGLSVSSKDGLGVDDFAKIYVAGVAGKPGFKSLRSLDDKTTGEHLEFEFELETFGVYRVIIERWVRAEHQVLVITQFPVLEKSEGLAAFRLVKESFDYKP